MLGPWAATALVRLVGLPVARVLRLPGELARRNAMRSPDRTAATASVLMVGLALVSFVTVLFTSTKAFLDGAGCPYAGLHRDQRRHDEHRQAGG